MEKIEITGRVFKIEEKENSNIFTLIVNKGVKINGSFETIKTYYQCIINKDIKTTYKVGDLILVRGNFIVDTYKKNDGTYTSAVKIFISEHECIMRKKADTPVASNEFNEVETNTTEPF